MNPADPSSTPAAPSLPKLEEGQKLAGIYLLRRPIASNPSETIWLAQDEVLGKEVSLHFIPTAIRGDTRAANELRQEVKRNRQLIHPGILRVYDLVEEADWSAVAMDGFAGNSLASILEKKPAKSADPAEAKGWLQQVCASLEDVHKIGIIHRNVSPRNIFVQSNGKVLIANFGISRVMEDALGRSRKQGGAEAHLSYMSPQQLDGENPARTDDVYSLGATIYEMVTGEPPFTGDGLVPKIRKALPETMAERRSKLGKPAVNIPAAWEKAVAACLAKNPPDRPQSVADLAGRLGLSKSGGETAAAAAASAPAAAPAAAAAAGAVAAATKTPAKTSEAPAAAKTSAPAAASGKTSAAPVPAANEKKPVAEKKSADVTERKDERLLKEVEAARAAKAANTAAAAKTAPSTPTPAAEKPAPVPAPEKSKSVKTGPAEAGASPEKLKNDVYTELYPSKSKAPLTGIVLVAVLGVIGLSIWYFGRDHSEDTPAGPTAHQGADSLSLVNNSQPSVEDGPALAPAPSPASAPEPTLEPEPTLTPAPAMEEPLALPSKGPGESPTAAASIMPEVESGTLLAQNRSPNRRSTPAPEAAKDPSAQPTLTAGGSAAPAGDVSVAEARKALEAADKAAQDARKQQQTAEAALGEAKSMLESRVKTAGPAQKTIDDLRTQRTEREQKAKAAEEAAAQAKKAAEESARLAAEAKKALTDFDGQNKEKLAAHEKLDSELQTLRKAVEVKQRSVDEAARLATESEAAKTERVAALERAEAEAKRMAAAKAAEEARTQKRVLIDKELQGIEEMRRQLQQKMEELDSLRKQLDDPAATPAAAPTTTAPAAPTAPAGARAPGQTPPPAPPGPRPILPASGALTPGATPALPEGADVLAMKTDTGSLMPSEPAPSPEADRQEDPAASGKVSFVNSLGMKFAPVDDVLFCIWPTRVQDFEVYAREERSRYSPWRNPGYKQETNHPVVNVTWNEAMSFCKWLTEKERKSGELSKDQAYRLPTDLEWSKAVGLPAETGKSPEARDMAVPDVFPWGTQWPPPPNVGNYTGDETGSDVAIKGYDDGYAWTSPVGSFPANQYGLYDMGGNVWQWVMDSWNSTSKAKVLRGASWYNGALKISLLSSCRFNSNPDNRSDNFGFRIVRVAETASRRSR